MASAGLSPFPSFRTALVTGASSGIGAAIASSLADMGLTVYGTSRRPPQTHRSRAFSLITLDAASPQGLHRFMEENRGLLESVDVLVNNCGGGSFGDLPDLDASVLEEQVQLLLTSPMALTRAVLPGMRERGKGAIVNISSLAAEFPLPYQAPYSAAKSGLSQFTGSLILTETCRDLILLDVQPGDINTAFNRALARSEALSEQEARVWEEVERQLAAGPPPEVVARQIIRALAKGRSRRLRTGGFFQCHLAPLGTRLLPRSALLHMIRRYYRIGKIAGTKDG